MGQIKKVRTRSFINPLRKSYFNLGRLVEIANKFFPKPVSIISPETPRQLTTLSSILLLIGPLINLLHKYSNAESCSVSPRPDLYK